MQDIIQQKTILIEEQESHSQSLSNDNQKLSRAIQELRAAQDMVSKEHKYEIDNLNQEWHHKYGNLKLEQIDFSNELRQQVKTVERERDRLVRDIQNLKTQIKSKEQNVKSEVERIIQDYQERLEEAEGKMTEDEHKLSSVEATNRA